MQFTICNYFSTHTIHLIFLHFHSSLSSSYFEDFNTHPNTIQFPPYLSIHHPLPFPTPNLNTFISQLNLIYSSPTQITTHAYHYLLVLPIFSFSTQNTSINFDIAKHILKSRNTFHSIFAIRFLLNRKPHLAFLWTIKLKKLTEKSIG